MDHRPFLTAAVVLTAAAGVLHLLAARAHAGMTLLLVIGFVLVAVVQVALVATVRRWPSATVEALLGVNLAAVGAWAVSRTVGLPGLAVEPVGAGDIATVALELVAIALALAPARVSRGLDAVPALAVVAALATVGLAAPGLGHAHDDGGHGDAAAPRIVQLGPGDFEGETDVTDPGAGDDMKALMTGEVEQLVITSEGRRLGAHGDDHASELVLQAPPSETPAPARTASAGSATGDDDHPHAPGAAPHDD